MIVSVLRGLLCFFHDKRAGIFSEYGKYLVALHSKISTMIIIETVASLREVLQGSREEGKTIGFVPTMGALHEGHAALVKRCVAENDVCVVSVFVNPTQFNNPDDLRLYPRTPEEDYRLLEAIGTDVVFTPSVEEMYPEPDKRVFDFGELDKVMEGAFRPGHFNGVAQVVSKLFDFVQPDRAYFGEKDFQQLAVVREMTKQLGISLEIVAVPTVREASGLALSSRNQRLSAEGRASAPAIYRVLQESVSLMESRSPGEVASWAAEAINNVSGLRVEYFMIVDADSLQPVSSWSDAGRVIGCIAVYSDEVRLIDNIRYK